MARHVAFVHQNEGVDGANKSDGVTDTVPMDECDEDEDAFSENKKRKRTINIPS